MLFNYLSPKYLGALFILIGASISSYAQYDSVEKTIISVEKQLPAHVGVSIYNTETKKTWNYKGDSRVPLMSTFKTLACGKLLSDVDKGGSSLDKSVLVEKKDLVTYSPITENYVGKEITLAEACSAAMLTSDNTAANIILNNTGGPSELTRFIQGIGDHTTRLDRFEPELNEAKSGDLRDTTSPSAMVNSLNALLFGNVLSPQSTSQLKQWMMDNQVSDNLLRSVLPIGWKIADRAGAGGNGSRGIAAVIWSEKLAPIIISIYITQTNASFDDRNKAIAEIGKSIFLLFNSKTKAG